MDSNAHPQVLPGAMDSALPAQSVLNKHRAVIGVSIVVVAVLALLFMRYGRTDTQLINKDLVSLATVQRGPFQEYLPLIGTLRPINTVFVEASLPGQVVEVLAEAGAIVNAGQILFRISSSNPQNELTNSETLLAQQVNALGSTKLQYEQTRLNTERSIIDLRAALEHLTVNHARLLRIKDSGVIRQADIDDEEIDIEQRKQSLDAMKRSLALSESQGREQINTMQRVIDSLNVKLAFARKNMDLLQIRATVPGQLTSFDVHVGQLVAPGQRTGQIDQLDRTKVVAAVDEFYLNRVAVNQSAVAIVDGKDRLLKVIKRYPEIRNQSFSVDFEFLDVSSDLHVGQSLSLRLTLSDVTQALVVANGSFYEAADQGVFVVNGNGLTAQRRSVKLGRRNTEQVEILDGLAPGERIVTSSYQAFGGINQLNFN